jgi:hypothetical protein
MGGFPVLFRYQFLYNFISRYIGDDVMCKTNEQKHDPLSKASLTAQMVMYN